MKAFLSRYSYHLQPRSAPCATLRTSARMQLNLKPTSARVKDYYNALNQYGQLNISHETAVRQAFASPLDDCAKKFQWKLVQEFPISLPKNKRIILDGAVLDTFTLKHDYTYPALRAGLLSAPPSALMRAQMYMVFHAAFLQTAAL